MDDKGFEDFNFLSFFRNKSKSTAWIKIIRLLS